MLCMESFARRPWAIVANVMVPCIPIVPTVITGPHAYLVAQPSGHAFLPPEDTLLNPPGDQTHAFGAPGDMSNNLLAGLSPEDVAFLNASFPTETSDNSFGPGVFPPLADAASFTSSAAAFSAPFQLQHTQAQYGLGLDDGNTFTRNTANIPTAAEPRSTIQSSTHFPAAAEVARFDMFNSPDRSTGIGTSNSGGPLRRIGQGTHPTAASAPDSAPPTPHGQLQPHTPAHAPDALGRLGLACPPAENAVGSPGQVVQQPQTCLQVPTPARRAVSSPDIRANAVLDNLPTWTPTRRSSAPHSPAAPGAPGAPGSALRSGYRGSAPSTGPRAALLHPLPATPRAFSPNPFSSSVPTPVRPIAHSAPLASAFRPVGRLGIETASVLGSRASTPCPSASRSIGHSAHVPVPASPAPSLPQPALPPSPPVPREDIPDLGNSDTLGSNAGWDGLDGWDENDHNEGPGSSNRYGMGSPATNQQRHQTPHRVRTPPPLARAFNRVLDLGDVDVTDTSDGFVVDNSELEFPPPRVQLIPPVTTTAPTTAELAINKAKEIQVFRKSRKSNENQDLGPMKRGERIGKFSHEQQEFLSVMKAYLLWEFVSRSAWSEDDAGQVTRAKDFASTNTGLSGDDMLTESLSQAVSLHMRYLYKAGSNKLPQAMRGRSQLRGLCHPAVLALVQDYFTVSEGDVHKVNRLLVRSRFLFPDNHMVSHVSPYPCCIILSNVFAAPW